MNLILEHAGGCTVTGSSSGCRDSDSEHETSLSTTAEYFQVHIALLPLSQLITSSYSASESRLSPGPGLSGRLGPGGPGLGVRRRVTVQVAHCPAPVAATLMPEFGFQAWVPLMAPASLDTFALTVTVGGPSFGRRRRAGRPDPGFEIGQLSMHRAKQ